MSELLAFGQECLHLAIRACADFFAGCCEGFARQGRHQSAGQQAGQQGGVVIPQEDSLQGFPRRYFLQPFEALTVSGEGACSLQLGHPAALHHAETRFAEWIVARNAVFKIVPAQGPDFKKTRTHQRQPGLQILFHCGGVVLKAVDLDNDGFAIAADELQQKIHATGGELVSSVALLDLHLGLDVPAFRFARRLDREHVALAPGSIALFV